MFDQPRFSGMNCGDAGIENRTDPRLYTFFYNSTTPVLNLSHSTSETLKCFDLAKAPHCATTTYTHTHLSLVCFKRFTVGYIS